MIDGLSFADKGADQGVDVLKLPCGKVKAIAGINESISVLLLCGLGRIKTLLKMAEMPFMAGIAQMKGIMKERITKSLNIIRTVFFCFGAGPAFFPAAGRAADMPERAGRGIDAVTAPWGVNQRMFFDLPGKRGRGFVKTISDVAEREPFRQKSLQPGTFVEGKVFRSFLLHKNQPFYK